MKKYLFGLGAMLVGAGLMFVLMHGEVSADNKEVPEPFVCSAMTTFEYLKGDHRRVSLLNCQTKNLDCGYSVGSDHASCVKKGMFK
jgi:hypothetical protein